MAFICNGIWWLTEVPIQNAYLTHILNYSIFNIYFYAIGMLHSKLFPKHLYLYALAFWWFIYLSFSDSCTHTYLMDCSNSHLLLPSLMPDPFPAATFFSTSTHPSLTSFFPCDPLGLSRIAQAPWEPCVVFLCGCSKVYAALRRKKSLHDLFRWTCLAFFCFLLLKINFSHIIYSG